MFLLFIHKFHILIYVERRYRFGIGIMLTYTLRKYIYSTYSLLTDYGCHNQN